MQACHAGGDTHYGEYLFSTTISSVQLNTSDWAMVPNLDPRGRFMQDAGCELRRISLPRTSVNKGRKEGQMWCEA